MSDGWNENNVYDIIKVCDDIYDLNYELKNAVRGCYTGVETYKDLAEYVKKLANELMIAANDLGCVANSYDEQDELND